MKNIKKAMNDLAKGNKNIAKKNTNRITSEKVECIYASSLDKEFFKPSVPTNGNITFEGRADDILSSLSRLLQNKNVHLSVVWDLLED